MVLMSNEVRGASVNSNEYPISSMFKMAPATPFLWLCSFLLCCYPAEDDRFPMSLVFVKSLAIMQIISVTSRFFDLALPPFLNSFS